ncbi:BMP family ABC transporter substrate-binding protein [Streptomyces venezuelae]|uniref:BMP family ABC transporter substrate-binding protein n=1 Tax=Streptomyces venezuelae TaxID=54571 RepID=UPI00123DF1B9|nr:BMP family ABC transporter substrate-binding protein [Streptomyces venezuelae]QES14760.1 BMP family ABC transporter substrate-binding protein [Streptomyces venezuelae]
MKTRRAWRATERQAAKKEAAESGAARVPGLLATGAAALRGRTGWVLGSVLVLALGLVGVRLFAGSDDAGTPPDTRARAYQDYDACLLTDERGIVTGAPAAPVWEGMQAASLNTRIRVTYVPVTGEKSAANARPFLNGLVQRDCEIVVASGAPQVEAVEAAVEKNPKVRFVTVDGAGGVSRDNLVRVASGASLKDDVAATVKRLAQEG